MIWPGRKASLGIRFSMVSCQMLTKETSTVTLLAKEHGNITPGLSDVSHVSEAPHSKNRLIGTSLLQRLWCQNFSLGHLDRAKFLLNMRIATTWSKAVSSETAKTANTIRWINRNQLCLDLQVKTFEKVTFIHSLYYHGHHILSRIYLRILYIRNCKSNLTTFHDV